MLCITGVGFGARAPRYRAPTGLRGRLGRTTKGLRRSWEPRQGSQSASSSPVPLLGAGRADRPVQTAGHADVPRAGQPGTSRRLNGRAGRQAGPGSARTGAGRRRRGRNRGASATWRPREGGGRERSREAAPRCAGRDFGWR